MDFNEIFAYMAKLTTIRTIVVIRVVIDLEVRKIDVKTMFLNGDFEEDIYIEQLQGFIEEDKHHLVCKLEKSLYGLKQLPRACYQLIDSFFMEEYIVKNKIYYSLNVLQAKDFLLFFILNLDNLII